MDGLKIKKLLSSVKSGKLSIDTAFKKLQHLPYEDLSFAKVDHHRNIRQGIPEVILADGTSDIPGAEEAAVTASFLGSRVETAYDVGVAGIHRLLNTRKSIDSARVIIVVEGMEGGLH